MNLEQFLTLPEEHDLSADSVQKLNQDLSSKTISDIPFEKRSIVNEYLVNVLIMEAVEPVIKGKLEALLIELQNA
ncbi:hypothetical protein [Marinomonas pollencensis]|uniref:Uncharacterized protein n=1 Tax=Marinomonas pollencensis TaxID=491954 RepID=A0A3E0DHS9_9GAMM|nr:hypothetical protein [Marinomonas pollencensis]REG82155.1 hypothetical protein DFP81_11042 [Marinomonas pollencensis]